MPYLQLLAGLAALIVCGNWLVSGGVELARHFKISSLVVGLTIVAGATSAPELFVSTKAALSGSPDIALGNVIGSNITNIGCILGITALIMPIPLKSKSIVFDIGVMFAVTALLLVFGLNGTLSRVEGICLFAIFIAYTVFAIRSAKKKAATEEFEAPEKKLITALAFIAASIAGLYFGAEFFVTGAKEIALQWGVSERVIGVSIVAIGTSIPELVTSLIAALRKESDLSIGNIIGSNIFNIVVVLGITGTIAPLNIGDLQLFIKDMVWVFGISIALVLTMVPISKGIIKRHEGAFLLILYAAYIFLLYR